MTKAILIATIGTRDLIFQIASGGWYNVGDNRMQNGEIIGEQAEVIADLNLGEIEYRDLTQHLFDQIEIYRDRIKPVILGKLLNEKASDLETIYLVGTNQNLGVRQREKDTLYACEIIKTWVEEHHQISVEILHLGADGTNPSDFEAMFRWWRRSWREKIQVQPDQSIWLCLKGGVGQASEAGRISGLSLYGDRIKFFDFQQNFEKNQAGTPSDYSGPFLGTNYLWDRTQQQGLRLLERFDYAGAKELLSPYFQQDPAGFGVLPTLMKAGVAWNQGEFETFFKLSKNTLTMPERRREQTWWWKAYEQAYLGVVRLKQENTTESMLHSFRAVEGALSEWAIARFPSQTEVIPNGFSLLLPSILEVYPRLQPSYEKARGNDHSAQLRGKLLKSLLEVAIPETTGQDFRAFWAEDCRQMRNALSHRLGGLSQQDVLRAWGVQTQPEWEIRVLNCLNLLTGQSFRTLEKASLFCSVHEKVMSKIKTYELPT